MSRIVKSGLIQAHNVASPDAPIDQIKKANLDHQMKFVEEAARAGSCSSKRLLCRCNKPRRLGRALENRRILRTKLFLRFSRSDNRRIRKGKRQTHYCRSCNYLINLFCCVRFLLVRKPRETGNIPGRFDVFEKPQAIEKRR